MIIGSVSWTSLRNAASLLCVLIAPTFHKFFAWQLTIKPGCQAGKVIFFIRGNGIGWKIFAAYGIVAQAGDTPLFPAYLMRYTNFPKLRHKGGLRGFCGVYPVSG